MLISLQSSFTAEFGGIESSEMREREICNTICAADTQSKLEQRKRTFPEGRQGIRP